MSDGTDRRALFQGLKPFAIESIVLKREVTSFESITPEEAKKLLAYQEYLKESIEANRGICTPGPKPEIISEGGFE